VELTHSREQLALRAAVHEFLARARRGRPVDGSCDVETWKGLAGGIGFTWEHPLHRYLKRAQGRAARVLCRGLEDVDGTR
jgi:hypothetical protein